jgi:predicted O-methyltransferase YrrM
MSRKKRLSETINEAMQEISGNYMSDTEKVWIDKIEAMRDELSRSSEEVTMIDYGAVSPNLNLTDEEMYRGRIMQTSVGELCRNSSQASEWGLFLFKLVRKLKPTVCLELGTCLGISTSYLSAALSLNNQGKIITLEGAETLASLAKQNFRTLGLEVASVCVGRFQDNLDNVLTAHSPIDFAFIDGYHSEHATLSYFEKMLPYLSNRAVVVFDDIYWSKGMARAWDKIQSHQQVYLSVDLGHVGVCGIQDSED